jgi:hypothetical protein
MVAPPCTPFALVSAVSRSYEGPSAAAFAERVHVATVRGGVGEEGVPVGSRPCIILRDSRPWDFCSK